MGQISSERHDSLAILKLDRGATNALDLELLLALEGELARAAEDPEMRGLVLGSANDKFLSIGFDIPWLLGISRDELREFYRTFNRVCLQLFTLPRPTVAAITGHATAGGCILATCCDYRFIAEGRKLMGLNEIRLGVPVPYLADQVLRIQVGWRAARDAVDSGALYDQAALSAIGLVEAVLPLDEVWPVAIRKAGELARHAGQAYAVMKRHRVEPVEQAFLAHRESDEERFIDCWLSDAARPLLEEAAEKF